MQLSLQRNMPHSSAAIMQASASSDLSSMADEEGQEVIFTENTLPDREIWHECGGLIKKGAAEIAERDQHLLRQPPQLQQPQQAADVEGAVGHDYTKVPHEMDKRFEELDTDS